MPSKTNNSLKGIKAQKNPAKGAAILKAAEKIFAQKGFHEATISDIAKKAEVSEATIYDYFSSKEELLFSTPAETIHQYQEKNLEIRNTEASKRTNDTRQRKDGQIGWGVLSSRFLVELPPISWY